MTNEQRAEQVIKKYGFYFNDIPKHEIVDLLQKEIANYQPGSSEYIRLLCGYLYCTTKIFGPKRRFNMSMIGEFGLCQRKTYENFVRLLKEHSLTRP